MGFFDKIFRQETKEEIKVKEKVERMADRGIVADAPLIENTIICNACGKEIIEGIPRFLNYNGKKMVFHKKCLKKLKAGNISF